MTPYIEAVFLVNSVHLIHASINSVPCLSTRIKPSQPVMGTLFSSAAPD